jgi:hypothetical protein
MSASADQIAADMLAALGDGRRPDRFAEWLADIWGDEVIITHTPPMANDGPMDGRKLGAGEVAIFKNMMQAIPDYHQEEFDAFAEGDVVTFSETCVGTLPDGTVHRAPLMYHFTIENGRIAKAHGFFTPEIVGPFTEVTAAAGLRTPE